jgi:hypothetical protein
MSIPRRHTGLTWSNSYVIALGGNQLTKAKSIWLKPCYPHYDQGEAILNY